MQEQTAPNNSAPSAAPPLALSLRAFRLLATAALSFALGILLCIYLLAKVSPMRRVIFSFMPPDSDGPLIFTILGLLLAFAVPLVVLVGGIRRGWLSWRLQAAIWVLVLGLGTYLAYDDPVVDMPATLAELAPALPGDAVSYKVMSRYSNLANVPKFKLDPKIQQLVASLKRDDSDTAKLQDNREGIEASWNEISVLHTWFAELAAFPRIGDLLTNAGDPIPPFTPLRTYSRYACAYAQLLALDGKGDEALALLGQLLDVSQKMFSTSRTLVRSMISIVMENITLTSAGYVLDHAATSATARAQLAATLAKGLTGPAGARRMILVEFVAYMYPVFANFSLGNMVSDYGSGHTPWLRPLNWLDPLLYNPRATLNLAGDSFNKIADLAAKRDLAGIEAFTTNLVGNWDGAVPVKNIGGRFMLSNAMPVFRGMAKQYWQVQDAAAAMLDRLKKMDAAK